MTVEDRAREVIGRAIDAVAVDPVPAPTAAARSGPGWRTWAAAVGAVAAAVVGFVVAAPDGGDDESAVSTADPTACVAEAQVVRPAGRIAEGLRPDGGPWEVHVVASPAQVDVFNVLPDRHTVPEAGAGVGRPLPGSGDEFLYALTPAPGGFVLGAELPPDAVRVDAISGDGSVRTACAHAVAGVDGLRYAGTFVTRGASDPVVLRAFAADGTLLAVAEDIPAGIWRDGAAGYSSAWRLESMRPATTTTATTGTTATTATTSVTTATTAPPVRPPVPSGNDPCGDEPPPFTVEDLPDGIDPTPVRYGEWRRSQTPPGYEAGGELYDPVFTYLDPDDPERRVDVFHGNSWRLGVALRDQLTVLGHDAWRSDVAEGRVLIDFQVDGSGDPCDFWGLRNAGPVTEAELLAAAESIVAGVG